MKAIERIERPAVYPGAWMDTTDQARALIGCNTCGWQDEGPYEEVRAKWLAHTHDPVFDIEARLKGEPQLMPTTDVIWLLAQREAMQDLVEAAQALSEQQHVCEDGDFTDNDQAASAFDALYAAWTAMRRALERVEAGE